MRCSIPSPHCTSTAGDVRPAKGAILDMDLGITVTHLCLRCRGRFERSPNAQINLQILKLMINSGAGSIEDLVALQNQKIMQLQDQVLTLQQDKELLQLQDKNTIKEITAMSSYSKGLADKLEHTEQVAEERKKRLRAIQFCKSKNKRPKITHNEQTNMQMHQPDNLKHCYLFIYKQNCQQRLWDHFRHLLKKGGIDLPSFKQIKESSVARSYTTTINKMVPIHEFNDGVLHGAYVGLTNRLKFAVKASFDQIPSELTVCLGGDGRSYSHRSHSVGFGFHLMQEFNPTIVSYFFFNANEWIGMNAHQWFFQQGDFNTLFVYDGDEDNSKLIRACSDMDLELQHLKAHPLEVNGRQIQLNFIHSSDMVFTAALMGVKNANAKAPCLHCLVIGPARGDPKTHKSFHTRPYHNDDHEDIQNWESDHKGETFEFEPELGYTGGPALTLSAKDIAVEYLHFRLNLYKRIISHLAMHARSYSTLIKLNQYLNSISGLKVDLQWDGKKISVTHLKEDQIDILFHHHHSFETLFPQQLGTHLNRIFNLLSQLLNVGRHGTPSNNSTKAKNQNTIGQQLLEALLLQIDGFQPLFTQTQITPYLHSACAHLEDITKQIGPISKFSSSIIEAVNHQQVTMYLRNTMKGGGRNRENPWKHVLYRELLLAFDQSKLRGIKFQDSCDSNKNTLGWIMLHVRCSFSRVRLVCKVLLRTVLYS